MLRLVRDDRHHTNAGIKWMPLALATCTLVCLTGTTARAQDDSREFRATVVDMSSHSGRITIPLDRSVTVDTTIPTTRADVVAANIAQVDVISPTRLLIKGQSYGSTTVLLQGENEKQYMFQIFVELDLERLKEGLKEIDPLGKVNATSVRGHIVLTGTVSSAERARRMMEMAMLFLPIGQGGNPATTVQNHLDVAGEQQVLIKCTVAEVSRRGLRELGINGFLAGENFRDGFVVNQLGNINPINIGAAADANVTQNIPFLTGTDGIPLTSNPTLSLGFPRAQMQLFLRAMAENSLLSILAEPNLVAISGETATFLAGGEFPIPVPQGNQQVTIEFREFGVRLNFTPVVKGNEIIRLRVAPEVSELDFTTSVQIEGFVVPGLTSRSTETTVELGNGQTIAIGGLLSENARGLADRVPGIGDVPILGSLFRSVSYQRSLTELVILVTPEIVAPLEAHQSVALDNHNIKRPDDFELYALGLLEKAEPKDFEEPEHQDKTDDEPAAMGSQPHESAMHGPWGLEMAEMKQQ